MEFPPIPCHGTIHCVNWGFCRKCAPNFSLAVLEAYTKKARQTSGAYKEAINEVKAEIAENHHLLDEEDEKFQAAIHDLAARSVKPEE